MYLGSKCMPAVSAGDEYHKTQHSGRHAPPGRWYGSRKAYMYMPHNMEYQCAACCFLGHQRGHWHLGVLADPSLPCPSFLDVWCPESRPGSRLAHLGEGYMGNKPRESVRRVNTMRQVHESCDGLCETAAMGVISSLENRLTALSRHIGWTWTWALVGFSRHDPRKRGETFHLSLELEALPGVTGTVVSRHVRQIKELNSLSLRILVTPSGAPPTFF